MDSLNCPEIDPVRLCEELRTLVHDCLAKHMYDSAAFFAEKLVALTPEIPEHVYLLAQVGASSGHSMWRLDKVLIVHTAPATDLL
jgi:hypothetical protein